MTTETGVAVRVLMPTYDKTRPPVERWNGREWVAGRVTGTRVGQGDEDFDRIDVELVDGRRPAGCHPDCVQPLEVRCARCGDVLPEETVALLWDDRDFYEHGDHLAAYEPTPANFASARAIHAAHVAPG